MPKQIEDLTGQRFGRLVARELGPPKFLGKMRKKHTTWICDCDCGNEAIVTTKRLKSGATRSCGCLAKEIHSGLQKPNDYDLSGEYGIGYTTKGEEFYFDLEDYDKIKDIRWYIKNDYVYGVSRGKRNLKKIALHRIVLDVPPDMFVDHIGGSETKRDNRKSNLRIVTKQQNGMNHKPHGNNTSGKSGVYYDAHAKKWRARIYVNSKDINLGCFITKEKAIQARLEAENKYYKEYGFDYSQKLYKEGGLRY